MQFKILISILFIITFQTYLIAQPKKDSIPFMQTDSARVNQESTYAVTRELHESYLLSYWTDTKGVFSHPFHWKTGQIIAASAVTASTVGLFFLDKEINHFFIRNETVDIDNASLYFFDPLGKGFISIPVLGVFYLSGVIWKNPKAKETAYKGVEAFVITAVLTEALKQAFHRHRPYQDAFANPWLWDGPFYWGGADGPFDYNSFPSGHSSAIFAIATVISMEYWKTKWVPAICFTLAGLTAVSRIAVNKHWASDCLFGSALGFSIGALVYHNNFKKFQLLPVSESGMGATLIFHF